MSDSNSTNLLASTDMGEEANAEDKPPSIPWYLVSPHEIAQASNRDRENRPPSLAANRRFQQDGSNRLAAPPRPSALPLSITPFKSFSVVLLLTAAGLAFLLNKAREESGKQAIPALQQQIIPTTRPLRDNKKGQIPATTLVLGSFVVFSSKRGDRLRNELLNVYVPAFRRRLLPVNRYLTAKEMPF